MSNDSRFPPSTAASADPSPELQQVLCDLRSPDDWTRASAVRALCPCRRTDWGETVFRYVWAMRDDPSPIVRRAVQHDLSENRRWNESWEAELIQERRARRRKVTLALKGMPVSEVCATLRARTEVPLLAEDAVADQNVTLFCRQTSLRDVMRHLSHGLGLSWTWCYQKGASSHFELTRGARGPVPLDDRPEPAPADARLARDRLLKRPLLCPSPPGGRVTMAGLLEAIHQATGLAILADDAGRLHASDVALDGRPLYAVLEQLVGVTGLRWQLSEDRWLRFRSARTHRDPLRSVPAHGLERWARSRREGGVLTLDDLAEIASLPRQALDARGATEAAREEWGLAEWCLAAGGAREHLRVLAGLRPEQRARATSPEGLPFVAMSPARQNRFLEVALGPAGMATIPPEALSDAVLRVEYSVPGEYEWRVPGPAWLSCVVPLAPGPRGRRSLCPIARGATPEAAREAFCRVDPAIRAAVLAASRTGARLQHAPPPDEIQIAPTRLRLAFVYLPSATNEWPFLTCVATERGCRITRVRG